MKIIEGIQATGQHVWIVIESAVEGKKIETGFRTEAQARAYRAALLAYRKVPDRRLLMSVERLRRSAIITYGHELLARAENSAAFASFANSIERKTRKPAVGK
jgi:hypothetical protein